MSPTPDHVPCRNCGCSISWDEVCWTHDATGFADCGIVIVPECEISLGVWALREVRQEPRWADKRAEPAGSWT